MHRLLALALLLVAAVGAQSVRCFVRTYTLQEMNHSETGQRTTIYYTELDALVGSPLLLSLDDIGLSPVQVNHCPDAAPADMLRFMWSADPLFSAPFAALPLKCAARESMSFGLSTLGDRRWGTKPRTASDGSLFAVQGGRASMLTGAYSTRQTPQRHRTLSMRMTSYRTFERPLLVRTCVWADQVPYDLPAEMREVEPPRLLPLMGCTTDLGGRCGANLGYVNSAPMALDVRYPSALNRLLPAKMENGFQMVQRFEQGIHHPEEFQPPLHVSWPCQYGQDPEEAHWLLDGLVLALNNHASLCNDPSMPDAWRADISGVVARRRAMAAFQDQDPFVLRVLQEPEERRPGHHIKLALAEKHWQKAGVQNARMSTLAAESRANAAAAAAEAYGRVPDAAAPLNVTELAIKP